MGLMGSDLIQYLQTIAQGIRNFDQTGIPINEESVKSMGDTFGQAGLMPIRAMTMAGGMKQYLAGIGEQGPQGGMDLLAMQMLGGYKGGGAAEYEKAMIQLENMKMGKGNLGGPEVQAMMRHIIQIGGGGARGRLILKGYLGEHGIPMGTQEMAIMGKQLMGEPLDDTEKDYIAKGQKLRKAGARKAAEPLEQQAEEAVRARGGLVAKRAAITNQQIDVGQRVASSVLTLEQSALKINTSFLNLANGGLAKTSTGLLGLATVIESFTKKVEAAGGVLGYIKKHGDTGGKPKKEPSAVQAGT
jgi:hypothetical protein